ncbi:MAG TPA: lysophospholipid acyltransferase family protein [Verrucomicrobiae bacterium]
MTSPPPIPPRPRPSRRSGGIVVPHAPRWYQRAAAWLVYALVRSVSATLRMRWTDQSGEYKTKAAGPVIFCVWHNRLALSMPAYQNYARPRSNTPGMAALVSASRDGGFLAAILECFKVQPVRGSTSRRGPQALLELTTWAERGYDLAITPDGPRGPRYVVQEGAMSLARVTGLPIVPFSFYAKWKLQVKSWDRFQIPLPFGRCEMRLGKAVHVPREATDAERESLRVELEQTLKEISGD